MSAQRIAIVGAESTGKSWLTQALTAVMRMRGQTVYPVDEFLRSWCDREGRTPQTHEQKGIAQAQAQAVEQAPIGWVISDTTPLMTAVYSHMLFEDESLYPMALAHQALYDHTLIMGLDLPWVADGIQRDGTQMQRKIDARLREVLQGHGLHFSVVYGAQGQRCVSALAAIDQRAALRSMGPQQRQAGPSRWQWTCEKCSDAQCEHHLFTTLIAKGPSL